MPRFIGNTHETGCWKRKHYYTNSSSSMPLLDEHILLGPGFLISSQSRSFMGSCHLAPTMKSLSAAAFQKKLDKNFCTCDCEWRSASQFRSSRPLCLLVRQWHINNTHQLLAFHATVGMFVDLFKVLVAPLRPHGNNESTPRGELLHQALG